MQYAVSLDDIIDVSSANSDVGLYPTQKPLRLTIVLVELTTKENQIVLYHFCGSCTTIVAATELMRKYIGVKLYEIYFSIATVARLEKLRQDNRNDLFFGNASTIEK